MVLCKFCKDTGKILLLHSEVDCDQCSKLSSKILWTLEEGVALLRSLELELKLIKYTSALGGGVLFKGSSSKDIDIFIAPYNKTDTNYDLVINLLIKMGFIRKKTKEEVHKSFDYGNSTNVQHKHIEIWELNGKRVDFFFVE
jgi:hypothetical protein